MLDYIKERLLCPKNGVVSVLGYNESGFGLADGQFERESAALRRAFRAAIDPHFEYSRSHLDSCYQSVNLNKNTKGFSLFLKETKRTEVPLSFLVSPFNCQYFFKP